MRVRKLIVHLLLYPVILGGGKRLLPDRSSLTLR
jgi:hypothetical protein